MSLVLFRATIILAVAATAVFAQACETCTDKGWVECEGEGHTAHEACGVEFEHDCTTAFRARCCRGLRRVPCPDCRGAATELGEARDRRKSWIRAMSKLDLAIGKPFTHVRTKHFTVHCSIEEWRVTGKGKVSRNRLTHIIAERLEETAVAFEKIVGALPGRPQDAYIVWDREECIRASRQLDEKPIEGCHHSFTRNNAMWIGYPFHTSLYTDRGLHSYIVHNGAHLLLNGLGRRQAAPCWLQMGLASYITHRKFDGTKVNTHLCSPFVDAHPLRASRGWKKFVRKEVGRKKGIDLVALDGIKDILKAEYRQHAYAWTYASFFIAQGPEKLRSLIDLTKKGFNTLDAVDQVYGWKEDELQKRWRKFLRSGLR